MLSGSANQSSDRTQCPSNSSCTPPLHLLRAGTSDTRIKARELGLRRICSRGACAFGTNSMAVAKAGSPPFYFPDITTTEGASLLRSLQGWEPRTHVSWVGGVATLVFSKPLRLRVLRPCAFCKGGYDAACTTGFQRSQNRRCMLRRTRPSRKPAKDGNFFSRLR
jgi:hypothetical protein